jgi:hypothetical protein
MRVTDGKHMQASMLKNVGVDVIKNAGVDVKKMEQNFGVG